MEPIQRHLSPDGQYCLEIYAQPMRMSQEVQYPVLKALPAGEVLFNPGTLWEATQVKWSGDSRELRLEIRHHSDGVTLLDLDLELPGRKAIVFHRGRRITAGSFDALASEMQRITQIREIFY